MGGQPKCLCSLGEERIIDSLLARLSPQVDEILLNIAPGSTLAEDIFRHPTHRPAHISVVEDLYSTFSGPLAGIASSMQYLRARNSSANWLLSVASDTPFIPTDLYSRFLQATKLRNNHVYVAQHNHQQQYVLHSGISHYSHSWTQFYVQLKNTECKTYCVYCKPSPLIFLTAMKTHFLTLTLLRI